MGNDALSCGLCPRCNGALDLNAPSITCAGCRQDYPRVGSVVVAMPQVDAHLALWAAQLQLIARLAREQAQRLDAEAETTTSALAQERLQALARAVREQAADVARAFAPLTSAVDRFEPLELPAGAQSPLTYIHYLYRDWAWEQAGSRENSDNLAALLAVATPRPIGKALVFGAGACRLPYDLHHQRGADQIVVLDIDPFTFVLAEAIVRGGQLPLTEANLAVQEAGNVSRRWELRAPHGALNAETFSFVLGNGLAPPFADGSFDTVVTPWFIDQVPTDARAFFAILARMLVPGGRWLNQGPLLYPVDSPLARRHTREEIFALAAEAGFRIDNWAGDSRPYLVSPLNGRGRVEWVLTFEAVRVR